MASLTDPGRPATTTSFPLVPVLAVGSAIATVLAVSIAAQTYLSMLGHGHSFGRMLAWQMTTWGFWAGVAPFVLRWGAELVAHRPRRARGLLRLLLLALVLLVVHSVIATPLTVLIQPFAPFKTYEFGDAWFAQVSARLAADLLVYGLLVVVGRHSGRIVMRKSSRSGSHASRPNSRGRSSTRFGSRSSRTSCSTR